MTTTPETVGCTCPCGLRGLPTGTKVRHRKKDPTGQVGTVMPHEPQWSHGGFPVRWTDGIWERCDRSTVVTVVTSVTSAQRRSPAAA